MKNPKRQIRSAKQIRNHNVSNSKQTPFGFLGFDFWDLFRISDFGFRASPQSGQAVITAVIFFLIISLTVSIGLINPVLRQVKQADDFARARASLYVSQAANEDAVYRLKVGKQFVSPSTITLNGYTASASTTAVAGGILINSTGNALNLIRNIQSHLTNGSGASFHYGTQSGTGGITMNNSSSVTGNVFSNGPIVGNNSNQITGDVISSGPAGSISGSHVTGSAYAHSISGSSVGGDAYYQTISGTTVSGASHPGSADQATSSLPISDAEIASWEAAAVAGGTYGGSCPYNTPVSVALGPIKIPCDLNIAGDTVILKGPVWVTGNIDISNAATIKIDSSLGNRSVAIISDKSGDRLSGSHITISNSSTFQGSGAAGSFVLLLSQNNSAETGGGNEAITVSNNAEGDSLLYASHGKIQLSNSVSLKEVTAYQLELNNSANVIYQTGLVNLIFSSGPSGGYLFDKWAEK